MLSKMSLYDVDCMQSFSVTIAIANVKNIFRPTGATDQIGAQKIFFD